MTSGMENGRARRRLRIGVALRSSDSWMGGHNYVLSCIDALLALPVDERPEIHVLWTSPSSRRAAEPYLGRVDGMSHVSTAARHGVDFVYPVKEIVEAPSDVAWGGWIVDWQQRHLPQMFDQEELVMRDLRYRVMAESAPVVVHSSAQARDDTQRWAPQSHAALAVHKFRATLEPEALTGDAEEVHQRYRLPARFAIVCNQWYRHKNHVVVVDALGILRSRGVIIPCVMTGRPQDHRWPEYGQSVPERIASLGLEDIVHLVGFVPRLDQVLLIRAASVVIQPSLFEGWSTIVEEARALGKPIVLSDIPVHREQDPVGGMFFDPTDPIALADALERAWMAPPTPRGAGGAGDDHDRLQLDAGRSLLSLAETGLERYNAGQHDPARILLRMAREAAQFGPDGATARAFVTESIHIWFGRHPWRFPAFAADVLECDETTRAWFRSEVLPTMGQVGLRVNRLSWVDERPTPVGWYAGMVNLVREFTELSGTAAVEALAGEPALRAARS